jgi:hypothetical protein
MRRRNPLYRIVLKLLMTTPLSGGRSQEGWDSGADFENTGWFRRIDLIFAAKRSNNVGPVLCQVVDWGTKNCR